MAAEVNFSVTPEAAEKLKELAAKQGMEEPRLRVKVVSGGCAGLTYQMDFAKESPGEKEILWEINGVEVILDPMTALYVMNSELDFKDGLMGAGFKINNPNAKASCACGESFYV